MLAFRLDAEVAAQAAGACVLATVLFSGVIILVGTRSVREWCAR
ncbi:hypothetical protein [Glycomyces paridis]|nr:hypothetical protein [Glycomyces paridis]